MNPKNKSVSVIKGADGPASVFIAGRKERNLFRRIERALYDRKYQRKRNRAERSIVPGTHTIPEVIQYAEKRYGMAEVNPSYRGYEERKRIRRHSLISCKRLELLKEEKIFIPFY